MPNYTPETATAILSLPYTTTEDVSAAPTGTLYPSSCAGTQYFQTWWKYLTGPDERLFSFGADSDGFSPVVSIWVGTPGVDLAEYSLNGGSNLFCRNCAGGYFLEVPCEPGTTYYIQVESLEAGAPTNDVVVMMEPAPRVSAPAGALVITDENDGFPAALISAETGEILRYVTCPAGERGTQLPDGTICMENGDEANDPTSVVIMDRQFHHLATVDFAPDVVRRISSNFSDTFYVLTGAGFPATLRAVRPDGSLGGTWAIPADLANFEFCAVSRDDAIFYYSATSDQIKRWDLVNDVELDELSDTPLANKRGRGDGVVAADGSLWVGYEIGPTLRQLDQTTGAEIQAVDIGSADAVTLNHYALDHDDAHIWAWAYGTGGAGGTAPFAFQRVRMADGAIVASLTDTPSMSQSGYPKQVDAPFAVSTTCPFFVLTQEFPQPGPPHGITYPIRRVRRSPHMSKEQVFLFFARFQLDVEAGVGLPSGADPQVGLRWSDDGGHTWSNWYYVGAGKSGEYDRRAIWRRLGRSRDRVWEIVVSDPVPWNILQAIVDVAAGTN